MVPEPARLGAFLRRAVTCSFLAVSAATAAGAQLVTGQVLDQETKAAVPGAVVLLLNEQGVRVQGVLTDANGKFVLRAPLPGTYQLRAEMIARKSVETERFAVSEQSVVRTLELPAQPIQLAGIDASAGRRCSVEADMARATHDVLAEAQKALRAESITRAQERYRFEMAKYYRVLAGRGARDTIEQSVTRVVELANNPFRTLGPEELARNGYARTEMNGTYLYGPDTDVLISDGFLETHCFALRRNRNRPGQIAVVFQPIPGRKLTDIEGMLWLDEATNALRTLEFGYRNLPKRMIEGPYSGFSQFEKLPDGGWIIKRWSIRVPMPRGVGLVIEERAGEVLRVERAEPGGPRSDE